jgi:glycosyltransferase involved in cell wall biosynthesis
MLTIAIPNYNRSDYAVESFKNVISSDLVSEICIVDDFSDEEIYLNLVDTIQKKQEVDESYKKVKIFRNDTNLGAFLNKVESVRRSSNDWVILLDSDNIIDLDYLEIIKNLKDTKTIYSPSHAICASKSLDYTNLSGTILDRELYKQIITKGDTSMDCVLNTGNFYFHRDTYLECVDKELEKIIPLATDVFYLNYLWFKNIEGAKFEIVRDLKYQHRLHQGSYYVNNSAGSSKVLGEIKNTIKEL